jgi:FkbM family methyltransferase
MDRRVRVRAFVRAYVDVVRIYAFLTQEAPTARERWALIRFVFRTWAAELRLVPRRDEVIRFRGMDYVAARKIELHALAEVHRDRYYSRHPDFWPTAGMTVIDVGANVGVFALHSAAAGAQVIAVEPNADAYRRLRAAVKANGLEARIVTINAAVGAEAGRGRMVVPRGQSVLGFVDTSSPRSGADHVVVITLDDLIARRQIERIDLLKIDVEGAEYEVLRGSTRALRLVDRVIFEYHSKPLLAESLAALRAAGLLEVLRIEDTVEEGVGMLYAARSGPE